MKKCTLIILLSLILIIALAGCGSSGPKQEDTSISEIAGTSIGDVVKFGDYNGKPINWFVAEKEEGLYLLVSNSVIDQKPYNKEGGSTDSSSELYYANEWSQCSLREWLNGEFYDSAFSDTAKEYIVKCKLKNDVTEAYNKSGGMDTTDKVFILSYSECNKFLYPKDLLNIDGDEYWLRNPSGTNVLSARTCNGRISDTNLSEKVETSSGVRPAIWVTDKGIERTELSVSAATKERSSSSSSYDPDNFGYYDHDGDGQINDEEFQEATEYWMDQHESSSNSEYSPDNFGYYDYDNDGEISDEEFQDALEYYMEENGY